MGFVVRSTGHFFGSLFRNWRKEARETGQYGAIKQSLLASCFQTRTTTYSIPFVVPACLKQCNTLLIFAQQSTHMRIVISRRAFDYFCFGLKRTRLFQSGKCDCFSFLLKLNGNKMSWSNDKRKNYV